MRVCFGCVFVSVAAAVLRAGPAPAHHSLDAYDMETEIVLAGVVVEFQWTQPHTQTWLDVTDAAGAVTRWRLEGMSPSFLGRRGWTRYTLAPGDAVEIVVAPLKSGAPGGAFLRARLADGTETIMLGGR